MRRGRGSDQRVLHLVSTLIHGTARSRIDLFGARNTNDFLHIGMTLVTTVALVRLAKLHSSRHSLGIVHPTKFAEASAAVLGWLLHRGRPHLAGNGAQP
jgi:hypothetical protein